MLDFMRDALLHPSFPKEKVELYRDQQLAQIAAVSDDPAELARERWHQEVFAGHPLERPSVGLDETVKKLARADVVAHHRAFYRPDNTIVSLAGDFEPAAMLAELRRRFDGWSAEPTVVPPLPAIARAEKGKTVIEFRKAKQINLCFGHVSVPHTHPDFHALRVFEQVFCSSPAFTDRLSRTVREEEYLAYALGGHVVALERHPAPFMVFIGTGVENKLKAHDVALRIVKELLADGPKEEELEVAKGYLTRSLPFRWQSADEAARYMVTCRRLRLGIDWPLRYRAGIAAVTKEDVLRASRAHIVPDALTTVIVGPVDKDGRVVEEEK
jgi:zinc protease